MGWNDSAKGELGQETCIKYKPETRHDKFIRFAKSVDPSNPRRQFDVRAEMGDTKALKVYGLTSQGLYGDNRDEAPSWLNLVDRLKWNAWTEEKGKSKS